MTSAVASGRRRRGVQVSYVFVRHVGVLSVLHVLFGLERTNAHVRRVEENRFSFRRNTESRWEIHGPQLVTEVVI